MKKSLLFVLFSVLSLGYAQLVGSGEIYLQGQYVEVGIGECGCYGGDAAPAGYHPNVGSMLGFVADQDKDGWAVGAPNYCGDYFVPGSPYEAWGIQIGNGPTSTMFGNHTMCWTTMAPGTGVSYTVTPEGKVGVWEGDYISGGFNIHIKQTTTVPDTSLYFYTSVEITNNGVATINDVYYMRNVDPDNENPWTGDFVTTNVIEQQPADTNCYTALVSGTGNAFGCYLGMYSTGYQDARAFMEPWSFSFPWTAGGIGDMYHGVGSYTTTLDSTVVNDNGIGIANYWNSISPGGTVEYTFYYVLDFDEIDNLSTSGEILVNGVPAFFIDGTDITSACGGVGTDTLRYLGYVCENNGNIVDINLTTPYVYDWGGNPDIVALNTNQDSLMINMSADSIRYDGVGEYIMGVDTFYLFIEITLVKEILNPDFTYDIACVDKTTCFHDNSTSEVVFSSIQEITWNFDEVDLPTTSHALDTCVLLDEYRIHNVQLIATSIYGCKDTIVKPVRVLDSLQANFTYDPACEDEATQFYDATIYTDTTVTNWDWQFSLVPIATSSLEDPTHTFTAVGNYNIQLIVTNAVGCKDTVVKQVTTYPTPTVTFSGTPLSGCAPLEVDFTDLSTADTTDVTEWLWQFGDGDTSTAQNPSHTYTTYAYNLPDFYSVTLTVTSEYGCEATDTYTDYVIVTPQPEANFIITTPIINWVEGLDIQFNDVSFGTIASWDWDLGNGQTSTTQHPYTTYSDSGYYTISLIVTNIEGCIDSTETTIYIEPMFSCYWPNAFTPNTNELNEFFGPKGRGIVDFNMQIFDRWGVEIFNTTSLDKLWDGKEKNGTHYPAGVYAYRGYIRDFNGKEHEYVGHVTLIR